MSWTTTNFSRAAFRSSILTADLTYNIDNNTIFQISNLGPPTFQTITPFEYLSTYESVFGPQYPSNITDDINSIFSAWTGYVASHIFVWKGVPDTPVMEAAHTTGLANYLTFPLLFFQTGQGGWVSTYPPEYTVDVELSQQCVVQSIRPWAVLVYVGVVTFIFMWCVGGLVMAFFLDTTPETSSFDLVDFTAAVIANRFDKSLADTFDSLPFGRDHEIRKRLQDKAMCLPREGSELIELPRVPTSTGSIYNGLERFIT
jgi:hypothetical protein